MCVCVCCKIHFIFSDSYILIDPPLDIYGHSAFCPHFYGGPLKIKVCVHVCVYFCPDAEPGNAVDVIKTVQAPPHISVPLENWREGRKER